MTGHELSHFFEDWGWCGCGSPEAPAKLVLDVLRCAPFYEPANRLSLTTLLPNDGLFYFVLYMLDRADLIEHGGSVGGAWLTDRGKAVLQSLETLVATDPEFSTVFLDGIPPPDDCSICHPAEVEI